MANEEDEGLISKCKCGSRRISVVYEEEACAYFSEDGQDREDGHDLIECVLDFDRTYCRDCNKKRKLTDEDIALIEGE